MTDLHPDLEDTKVVVNPRVDDAGTTANPLVVSSLLGTLFEGRYQVDSLLGEGGSGQVYKCFDTVMKRTVALKVLIGRFDARAVRRFQTEATAISHLTHDHLMKVYDFGLSQENSPYIVMEYIEGNSLAEVLRSSGRLSPAQCIDLLTPIFDALQVMHDGGVIHRDLKPGNIIVSNVRGHQFAKLVDFGIAKIVSDSVNGQPQLTQTGEIFGSPLYMSPEQGCGIVVDSKTDQYSLGCMVFECLTGTTPHIGKSSIETLMLHQSAPTPTLKEASMGEQFPASIEHVVAKLLAKDSQERFSSMREAASALVSGNFIPAKPDAHSVQSENEARAAKRLRILIATNVISILLVAGFAFALFRKPPVKPMTPAISQKDIPQKAELLSASERSVQTVSDDVNERAMNTALLLRFLRDNALATDVRINADKTPVQAKAANESGINGLNFGGDINDRGLNGFVGMHHVEKLMILGCRQLTQAGFDSILALPLKEVRLTASSVDDATIKRLLKIPTLKRLYLKETNLTNDALIEPSKTLQALEVSNTKFDDNGMKHLAAFPSLNFLTASETSVTDRGIKALASMNFKGLLLGGTKITDLSADTIANMKELSHLTISRTMVSGKFLRKLSGLKMLKTLELSDCRNITSADVDAFKKEHPRCTVNAKSVGVDAYMAGLKDSGSLK